MFKPCQLHRLSQHFVVPPFGTPEKIEESFKNDFEHFDMLFKEKLQGKSFMKFLFGDDPYVVVYNGDSKSLARISDVEKNAFCAIYIKPYGISGSLVLVIISDEEGKRFLSCVKVSDSWDSEESGKIIPMVLTHVVPCHKDYELAEAREWAYERYIKEPEEKRYEIDDMFTSFFSDKELSYYLGEIKKLAAFFKVPVRVHFVSNMPRGLGELAGNFFAVSLKVGNVLYDFDDTGKCLYEKILSC